MGEHTPLPWKPRILHAEPSPHGLANVMVPPYLVYEWEEDGKKHTRFVVEASVTDGYEDEAVPNIRFIAEMSQELDDLKGKLAEIANIIESVDDRCMAADGDVTQTLDEMTPAEIKRIYKLSSGKVKPQKRFLDTTGRGEVGS